MPVTYKTTRRVEFNDTDMAGIMHFSKFFNFMEEAECEFYRSRGVSVVMRKQEPRIGLPRVGASCDFMKPVFFEDIVDIHLTLSRIGTKSLTFSVEFFKQGELVARGQISNCCCLMGGPNGPVGFPLPADIKMKLESTPLSGATG